MKVKIFGLIILAALTGCQHIGGPGSGALPVVPDGMTLIETVTRQSGDEIVIPYRKYRLENGLTVILHEDNSDPLVHVDLTYHVGSAREEVGKSGFAHFFEHMMFQGSENVTDEQHWKIISEAGGTMNGTTSTDRTNYYQTVPSNQLEKVLWLEADRMGFLLDAVSQEKFEIQRKTVKNERGERVDNRPYGLVGERMDEALYPEGHPYSWSTIGYVEDLDRVDVNDLKKFFLRWYGPNNALLTIGGRFEETETLSWIDKYFGSIPSGPEVSMPEKPTVLLQSDRYISLEDNVALPLLYMAFPTVYRFHPDEAPLDVLMYALGVGETSVLYKNMVKTQLAVQAQASHGCQELACTFTVEALPNPAAGQTLADLEKIARASMAEFEQRGISDDDLVRTKMGIVSGMIYGLESVGGIDPRSIDGKTEYLAHYEYLTGNPNYIQSDIARYENVTKEDVIRVYRKYILGKPSVIMSIVPTGQTGLIAAPDNWERYTRKLPDYELIEAENLPLRRATDDFDRSVIPPAGENPSITLPEIWRDEMANGIKLLGALSTETPTTAISLRIDGGQRHEPLDKLGLARLTSAIMNEATQHSSNEALSDRLQKLGSSVSFGSDNDYTIMGIKSLTRNLDETLKIASEMLLLPKFDPQDFARVKAQMLQAIEQEKKKPGTVADVVFQLKMMGRNNPIAYLNMGTTETAANLMLEDVKQFYTDNYTPKTASVIAVSDLDQSALKKKFEVFADWTGSMPEKVTVNAFPPPDKTRIYLIDKPGAAQSEVIMGKVALPYDATGEFYRAGLANFVLGLDSNSRINLNLREDKGYTYGAQSSFSGLWDFGFFRATASVRTDATAASIQEFEKEIRLYNEEGLTVEELAFTRSAIGQEEARSYETPGQKLGFLSIILTYDLADDFVEEQNSILSNITRKELNTIASKYISMDGMQIIVVGDKSVIQSDLEGLGYEVVDLDVNGEEIQERPAR